MCVSHHTVFNLEPVYNYIKGGNSCLELNKHEAYLRRNLSLSSYLNQTLVKWTGHSRDFPACKEWLAIISYRISPWFCAYSGNKATSPNSQMKVGVQPLAAPFGTDNGSTWEREADRFSPDKEKVNGPN